MIAVLEPIQTAKCTCADVECSQRFSLSRLSCRGRGLGDECYCSVYDGF
jgi:hypothetical protein